MPSILKTLLIVAALVAVANANCKSTDAKWKKNQAPVVTQPSRSDPKMLLVSWDKIIDNVRCVDEWNLFIWQDGTDKARGQKMNIKGMSTTSKMVEVDPCVKYNFEIQFVEKDLFGSDEKSANVATFTSSAVPKITHLNKHAFDVTYHYDMVKKVHDLSKAAIRFNRSIIENPSCVKHVEIVGIEIPKPPPRSRSASGSARELAPGYGGSSGGHGSYPGSVGGQGANPGYGHGGHGSYPGSIGGQGSSPGYGHGGSSSGGHGSYPGYSGGYGSYPGYSGGYGSHPGHSGGHGSHPGHSSGSGSYPGYSGGWYSSNSRSSSVSSGSGGRGSYADVAGRPGSSSGGLGSQDNWYNQQPVTSNPFSGRKKRSPRRQTTTRRPSYTTERPGSSGSSLANGKVLPPFRTQTIEITANIKPCKAYKFTLKVVSPSGSTITEVKDLALPLLRDMDNYRPPPLSKMFNVQQQQGYNKAPLIKVMPGYGVPNECLDDFFEAVDNRMADLEGDVAFHLRQEANAHSRGAHLDRQLHQAKRLQLDKQFGCVCNHTTILLNTTEAKTYERYKDAFGHYEYKGEQNGRPYYIRVPPLFPNLPMGPPRHKRFIGNVGTTTTPRPGTAGQSVAAAAPKNAIQQQRQQQQQVIKPFFLYWDLKAKTWVVGPKMDGEKFVLRVESKKNHEAKCPADPKTLKMWQYSGTLTWHSSDLIRAACSIFH